MFTLHGCNERSFGSINCDLALVTGGAQGRHQLGVVGRLQARGQGTGQHNPLCSSGTLNNERVQLLAQLGIKMGSGGV